MKNFSSIVLAFLYAFTMFEQGIPVFQLATDTSMRAVISNYGARLMSLYAYNRTDRLEPL